MYHFIFVLFFFFKQKTAYEMRISDWSSDVCSSDLGSCVRGRGLTGAPLTMDGMDNVALDPALHARFAGIDRLYGTGALSRLATSRVAVVGMGGVGSWVVEALARSGVGHLTLIDADDICVSNKIGRASCRERVCQYV